MVSQRNTLPKKIDRHLATLSKFYAEKGDLDIQALIVNAQPRVHEECNLIPGSWNSVTYGHALYLAVPESIFLKYVENRCVIEDRIRFDLNKLNSISDECYTEVVIELEDASDPGWRNESGLLIDGKRVVSPTAINGIWEEGCFRAFLSHKSGMKKETAALKEQLRLYGISCFVAHQDIPPTKEWQDQIENALASMDGFVALLTNDFHDSDWTDQEVGYAFAMGVPMIAVNLGKDPYGFIGKFQGLSGTWNTAAEGVVKIFIKHDTMFNAYIMALRNCQTWEDGNTLGKVLPWINVATLQQVNDLVSAFNETSKLRGSFAFNGSRSYSYESGLVCYLNKLGSQQFRFAFNGLIEPCK